MTDVVRLDQARELHREWGEMDVEEIDQLDLWERLGRILGVPAQ